MRLFDSSWLSHSPALSQYTTRSEIFNAGNDWSYHKHLQLPSDSPVPGSLKWGLSKPTWFFTQSLLWKICPVVWEYAVALVDFTICFSISLLLFINRSHFPVGVLAVVQRRSRRAGWRSSTSRLQYVPIAVRLYRYDFHSLSGYGSSCQWKNFNEAGYPGM